MPVHSCFDLKDTTYLCVFNLYCTTPYTDRFFSLDGTLDGSYIYNTEFTNRLCYIDFYALPVKYLHPLKNGLFSGTDIDRDGVGNPIRLLQHT